MVNRSLLSSKLAELADRVNRIRSLGALSLEELTANRDAFDLASFNLMLAVQICADIAAHLIADERWPAAKNLSEGFARLEEQRVIATSVAQALRKAVGLRNLVAHGYASRRPSGHPFRRNGWARRPRSILPGSGELGRIAVSVS